MLVGKLRNHTANVCSMDQERTFIHHKTGLPTTMKTANIDASPEKQESETQLTPSEEPEVLIKYEGQTIRRQSDSVKAIHNTPLLCYFVR